MKIITAAAAILQAAADEVSKFVRNNTPESALLSGLAVDYQQYTAGNLNGTQAALAALVLFSTFIVTETSKDKAQIAAAAVK